MINANEARKMTQQRLDIMRTDAEACAESELEFIEQHILNAIEKGNDTITYSWSQALLDEWEVAADFFAKAMVDILQDQFNYRVEVYFPHQEWAITIKISW